MDDVKELSDIDLWDIAERHLRDTAKNYGELMGTPGVNVMPALTFVIQPLLKRFTEGERTAELYRAIMDLE